MLPLWYFMLGSIKMTKIIICLAAFLALWAVCLNYRVNTLKKENIALQSEKNALLETIKDYENAKVESDKTIKMLRDTTKSNKENLDWYNQRVPADVLNVLQKRHNRNKAN